LSKRLLVKITPQRQTKGLIGLS